MGGVLPSCCHPVDSGDSGNGPTRCKKKQVIASFCNGILQSKPLATDPNFPRETIGSQLKNITSAVLLLSDT